MKIKQLLRSRAGMLGLLAVLVVIVAIVWGSLQFAGKNRLITAVEIRIQPDTGVYFINAADVSDLLSKTVGNPTGKAASALNLTRAETKIKSLPFVQSAQVYAGLDGKLIVKVNQRIPVVRITNAAGETWFADTSGIKIPLRGHYAPNVLIANGNIQEKLSDSTRIYSPVCKDILALSRFIASDVFWNAQFEQCYVDNFNDLILVPRVGKHSIVIGNAENLPEKFANLRVFYEKGLKTMGWDKYRSISLKYRGQVVGIKSVSQTEQKKPNNVQKPQH
ncbi:MAG: hypothetical protein JNL57_04650 [Bacteroidetes bacterium]|nr:hypothetical protein [Bacteroidota bacterium]